MATGPGVIPHQITLMSVSEMAEMDQITYDCGIGPMNSTSIKFLMNPNPSTHGHNRLGFTGVLPQGHDKVISRSQQGQIRAKWVKLN